MSLLPSSGTRTSAAARQLLSTRDFTVRTMQFSHRDTVSIHLVRAAEAQHGIKPPVQAQFWVDEGSRRSSRMRNGGVRVSWNPSRSGRGDTGIFSWLIRTATLCGYAGTRVEAGLMGERGFWGHRGMAAADAENGRDTRASHIGSRPADRPWRLGAREGMTRVRRRRRRDRSPRHTSSDRAA